MVLEGRDECIHNLETLMQSEWGRTCRAFSDICLGKIMPECMEECPVDTGILRASIPACSFGEATEAECNVVLGAGGAAKKYARRQHEGLEFHHRVGKAKFIEDPVRRNAPDVPAMVAARKEGMKG